MVTINELKKQKEFRENAVKTLNEKINQNKKLKLLLNYALKENLSFIHTHKNEKIKVETHDHEMTLYYKGEKTFIYPKELFSSYENEELFILHIANNELSGNRDELFVDFDYLDNNYEYKDENIIAILENIAY